MVVVVMVLVPVLVEGGDADAGLVEGGTRSQGEERWRYLFVWFGLVGGLSLRRSSDDIMDGGLGMICEYPRRGGREDRTTLPGR